MLAMSGGFSPVVHLRIQVVELPMTRNAQRLATVPPWTRRRGSAAGDETLAACLESGFSAGDDAAKAAGVQGRELGHRASAEWRL